MTKRDQIRFQILNQVFAAEVAKGHLKWKVSDIARASRVSRPLIYYHFGRTKQSILTECLNVLAEEYFGLSPAREKMRQEGRLLEAILQTRQMLAKNPQLAVFYQKWRSGPSSPIKKQLILIEERYQKKLAESFPHLEAHEIIALHALLHGLITAPFLSVSEIEPALLMIRPFFFRALRRAENPKPAR